VMKSNAPSSGVVQASWGSLLGMKLNAPVSTVISGTFIVECEGRRTTLETGAFNFMPSKLPHEAWTTPEEGALLFITVDKAWDINWVGGPPTPTDFSPGRSR